MFKQKKKFTRFLLIIILMLVLFGVYLFWAAIRDYNWSQEYISTKGNEWHAYSQGNSRQSPFYLYSLFNRPITIIGMINKKESTVVQGSIIYVKNLWAKREIGIGRVSEEEYSYLINCDTFESGWDIGYRNISDKNNVNLNTIEWLTEENEESIEHYKTMCDLILTNAEIRSIIKLQQDLVNEYIKMPSPKEKSIVFYYMMAPLGALDPIYDPSGFKSPDGLINFLYGMYSSVFEVILEKAMTDVEFPLKQAADFNAFEYYKVNKDELNNIASAVSSDPNIQILGSWDSSNIYRVNNYFGDTKRKITWKIEPHESSYKYIVNRSEDRFEAQQNFAAKNKYDYILRQMSLNGIQSIYKCDGKIIFIMFAVVDNAFGYTYNASKGNDINCGLLVKRFNILNDQGINKDWRYWVAN